MEILMFLSLIFVGMMAPVIYWVFIKQDAERYFYRSIGCILAMSIMALVSKYLPLSISYSYIPIIFSAITFLFIVLYIWGYISLNLNDFEWRLLILLLPISFLVIILFVDNKKLEEYIPLNNTNVTTYVLITFLISTISILISWYKKTKDLNSELKMYKLKYNPSVFEEDLFILSNDKNRRLNFEHSMMRIYDIIKSDNFSPGKVIDVLSSHKFPSYLSHKIIDRIFSTDVLDGVKSLSFIEFAQTVLPEVFTLNKAYRSSSIDMRIYEDLYERIRISIRNDNKKHMDKIEKKIDDLSESISSNIGQTTVTLDRIDENIGCKNQIRELFHALEMPIATAELATSNLIKSFNSVADEKQIEKLKKVHNNINIIKSILFAYRELTYMNIYSDENTFFSIPVILNSIKAMVSDNKTVSEIELIDIPDSIPKYSTNLVVVLLLPLLHNALEASPANKKVKISYEEIESGHSITIVNYCGKLPNEKNLHTEGFSTKANNHIGSGISIVRRVSQSTGINFQISVKNNQVYAKIVFPKQSLKEEK